jgi:uncharacterized protein YjbI with pentapeptide repeats
MQTMPPQPQLPPGLTQLADLRTALKRDESLSGFVVNDQDLSGIKVKAVNMSEAKLSKVNFAGADLEKLGLIDVVLAQGDMTTAGCVEASWRRIRLSNMRCSGLKLQTSTLRDVTFEDCKLDLANFRFTKLKNVVFKDCVLDEADFYNAGLEKVQFLNCSMSQTEFSSATCQAVDLRTSDITAISGINGLAGTTIDSVQLVAISHALAASFKIRVSDV